MHSVDVLDRIEKMGELPILPQTLLHIQKVATDDRSSADDLAAVILKDEALTMRVLKVVNSSFYARRGEGRVRTVSRAVVVLGFETVRKLALGLSVFDMMSKLSRSPHLLEVARHSIVVAGFAQGLARAAGQCPPEEAFVAGLIHDVGKVVLIDCSPADYDQVLQDVENGCDGVDAERRHFGMAHPRAGRKLAVRWNLPADLQALIADHHDYDPLHPPRRLEPMAAVLLYADALSRFRGLETTREGELQVLAKAARVLGIRPAALEEIHADLLDELDDLGRSLGHEIGSLRDYAAVAQAQHGAAALDSDPAELARRTAEQLSLYQEVGRRLAAGRPAEEVLGYVVQGACEILGFSRAALMHRGREALEPWHVAGSGGEDLAEALRLPVRRETGAVALCLLERRPFHVPLARSEAYGDQAGAELLARTATTSFAVAPVLREGQAVGVIFADMGAEGCEVPSLLAQELAALADQAGLALAAAPAAV